MQKITNLARGLLNGDPLVVLVQRHVHVDLKRTLSHSFKLIFNLKEEVQEIFFLSCITAQDISIPLVHF